MHQTKITITSFNIVVLPRPNNHAFCFLVCIISTIKCEIKGDHSFVDYFNLFSLLDVEIHLLLL